VGMAVQLPDSIAKLIIPSVCPQGFMNVEAE
jgi:hypothetical protein